MKYIFAPIVSLILLASTAPVAYAQATSSDGVQDLSGVRFFLADKTIAKYVHVESVRHGETQFEIVYLPNGESIEIPVDLAQLNASGLRPEEKDEAQETAREMLELTLNQVLSDEFNGDMLLSESGEATVLDATENGTPAKKLNWFKQAFKINPEMYKPMPKGLPFPAKFKRFAEMSWQFIIVETVHASIDYYKRIRSAPKFQEYGVSVDLKIEPQIFIGKFNPTGRVKALRRSYGLALELAFNKSTKRLSVHTRLRRERGSGGLGLPAVKAELKVFQTDGTSRNQGGQSWYPVSPPVASFVLDRDHGGHYFAQGITFGFNTGDLIPGSTLTNTFAQYQQKVDPIDFKVVPQKAQAALNKAARAVLPRRPVPSINALTCSSIFG